MLIQKVIDDTPRRRLREIPGGMYRVSYPFIEMKHRVEMWATVK